MVGQDLYNKARSATMGARGEKDFEIRAYENLANAIVLTAVRDYQHALISLHKASFDSRAEEVKKSCENFFHSQYYRILTGLDGDWLMENAKKQVIERGYQRFFIGYDD